MIRVGASLRPENIYGVMLLDSPMQKLWEPMVGDQVVSVQDPKVVHLLLAIDDDGNVVTLGGIRFALEDARWIPTFSQLMHVGTIVLEMSAPEFLIALRRWQFWIGRKYHQAGWFWHECMSVLGMIHWQTWGISFDPIEKRLLRGEEALAYEARDEEFGRKSITYLRGTRVEPNRGADQNQG